MRIISWNVNGLRSILSKGFQSTMNGEDPDIICLQETKVDGGSIPDLGEIPQIHHFFNCAEKPGYSGTAALLKFPPKSWERQTAPEQLLDPAEGRVIILDLGNFFLVNVYTPNARNDLARLPLRRDLWDPAFLRLLSSLDGKKPTVVCGDFNVAHQPIDLARPAANRGCAGFTDGERSGFGAYLSGGFVDIFRRLHPDRSDAYSWWSYRSGARARNVGWRIDYFLVSARLASAVTRCEILSTIGGSDHAPILLELEMP